jgi:hypothetical protein
VGFDDCVLPVGLARRRSRSVEALISLGASKARFLRPTLIWANTRASTSRVIAWFVRLKCAPDEFGSSTDSDDRPSRRGAD